MVATKTIEIFFWGIKDDLNLLESSIQLSSCDLIMEVLKILQHAPPYRSLLVVL